MLASAPLHHAVAADLISVGSVDATSANLWPLHIAVKNGYFDEAGLKIDLVFSQSNASVIQQLAAGSYNVAPSAGMVELSCQKVKTTLCRVKVAGLSSC